MSLFFIFFLFLHVHVHTHVRAHSWFYGCPCVYVHVHRKAREHLPSGISGPIIHLVFFFFFSVFFWAGVPPWPGTCQVVLVWPGRESQKSICLCLPTAGITIMSHDTCIFLHGFWDSNQVLSKYFTHWAVSQVHLFAFYSWATLLPRLVPNWQAQAVPHTESGKELGIQAQAGAPHSAS